VKALDLSVCIASWNTRELLKQCLASVHGTTSNLRCEVLVVDNASTDESAEMVRREFPAVRLFVNGTNEGFAAGSNKAIRQSTGRYVLLLNSDTVVLPDTLGHMVGFLESHPRVGVVGCKLLNPDGTVQLSCRRFPTLSWDYVRVILFSKLFHHVKPLRTALQPLLHGDAADDPRLVDWVSGAALMSRREVFDHVGLLDERFFMFCEEIDWCYRVSSAGWQIYYLPDAGVIHYGGESSRQHRLRTYWLLLESTYRYFTKSRAHATRPSNRPF